MRVVRNVKRVFGGNGRPNGDAGGRLKTAGKDLEKTIKIVVPRIDVREIELCLVGTSSLIIHRFGEKARGQMAEKDEQKPGSTAGRPPRNPKEEYEESFHRDSSGRYCFPATAFKSAAVTAVTSLGKQMSKMLARQSHHIVGDMIPIESESGPVMRTDTVKIGKGTATLRYRPEFKDWRVKLRIAYNANCISPEQLANLYNLAGFAVGVGEWRPQRNGPFGRFKVS